MSDQTHAHVQTQQKTGTGSLPSSHLLQRTCACGQHTIAGGQCSTCQNEQISSGRTQSALGVLSASAPAQQNIPSMNSGSSGSSRFDHDFSQIPIHTSPHPMLQTKLTVNQPGDVYEQEADLVAKRVMRMANPAAPVPDEEDEDETKKSLMRKPRSEPGAYGATDTSSVPPIVHDVLNGGGGQPLDATTRAFMEPRFGHDFSQVRVHTDGRAAESARAVNALAYTVGRDVVFGMGQYVPGTSVGRRLLAHELTHVVQQDESRNAERVDSPRTPLTLQRQPATQTDDPQKKPGEKKVITQPPPQKVPAPEAKKADKGLEKAVSVGIETETKSEKDTTTGKDETTTEVAGKVSFEVTIPITDKLKLGPAWFLKEMGVEGSIDSSANLELEASFKVISLEWERKAPFGIADFSISASTLASIDTKSTSKIGAVGEAEAKFKRNEESPWFITVKGGVEKTYNNDGSAELKWGPLTWKTGVAFGREF
jgi:Domain of unknown function (DUF4157)